MIHPERRDSDRCGHADRLGALVEPAARGLTLLPTPKATNNENRSSAWANGPNLGEAVAALLPTPTAHLADNGGPQHPDKRRAGGHAVSLDDAVHALLPTPRATDGTKGGPNQRGSSGDLMLPSAVHADRWGDYAAAIARWERTLGRPAPNPTKPGRTGNPRLNPQLVEWMMGWPPGHVTNVPGITDPQALRICGNGVVPQQADAATRALLHDLATESAA